MNMKGYDIVKECAKQYPEWYNRLKDELYELGERKDKLKQFIKNYELFSKLDLMNQDLLSIQLSQMISLYNLLDLRLRYNR